MLTIDVGRCDGCGVCVYACPEGAVSLVEELARIDSAKCTECEICVRGCPQQAVRVARPIAVRSEAGVVSQKESVPKTTLGGLATAALGFVGRYLVPRAVDALANVLERGVGKGLPEEKAELSKSPKQSPASGSIGGTRVTRGGGRQRRYRGGN
jgi:Pyruvate/2-oxoacid:ferredoxin oxidoreductase delta subunit